MSSCEDVIEHMVGEVLRHAGAMHQSSQKSDQIEIAIANASPSFCTSPASHTFQKSSKTNRSAPLLAQPPSFVPNPVFHPVGILAWSADAALLATRADTHPTAVWIWDTSSFQLLAVLVNRHPVRAAAWDSRGIRLAMCTETAAVYVWVRGGASCLPLPKGEFGQFDVTDLKWSGGAGLECLSLQSRNSLCLAFFVAGMGDGSEEEQVEEGWGGGKLIDTPQGVECF